MVNGMEKNFNDFKTFGIVSLKEVKQCWHTIIEIVEVRGRR